MTGYEQELRKLFENSGLIDRPQFSGRVCVCSLSMIVVLVISVAIVVTTKNVSSAKVVKKPKKTALKKGW